MKGYQEYENGRNEDQLFLNRGIYSVLQNSNKKKIKRV